MSALRSILLRREAGIVVMIVLFCLAVGAHQAAVPDARQLRIILLLMPLIMIGAMGQMLVHRRPPCRSVDRLDAGLFGDGHRHDVPRSSRDAGGPRLPRRRSASAPLLGLVNGVVGHAVPPARDHRHAGHAQPLSRPDLHHLGRQADRPPVDPVRAQGACRRPRRSSASRGSSSSPSASRSLTYLVRSCTPASAGRSMRSAPTRSAAPLRGITVAA